MLKVLFDIQRKYVDGSIFGYKVYYKQGASFKLISDELFKSRDAANTFIDTLIS